MSIQKELLVLGWISKDEELELRFLTLKDGHPKHGYGQRVAVFGTHSMSQREADTVPDGLRGEGNEDLLQVGGGDAVACVLYGNGRFTGTRTPRLVPMQSAPFSCVKTCLATRNSQCRIVEVPSDKYLDSPLDQEYAARPLPIVGGS